MDRRRVILNGQIPLGLIDRYVADFLIKHEWASKILGVAVSDASDDSKKPIKGKVTKSSGTRKPRSTAKNTPENPIENTSSKSAASPEAPQSQTGSPSNEARAAASEEGVSSKASHDAPVPPTGGVDNIPSFASKMFGALTKNMSPRLVWIIAIALAAFVLFFVVDKIFLYVFARDYIDQVSKVFDLNRHLSAALSFVLFICIAAASSAVISFNKEKRAVGFAFLCAVVVGHSLALWQGTKDQAFDSQGAAIKCYVVTRQSIVIRENIGIDPATGKQCVPVTPEVVERIKEYDRGKRPTLIQGGNPTFFDPRTGAPVLWFSKGADSSIELYDLMGFHPRTGGELVPVTREIADLWQKQFELSQNLVNRVSRGAPKLVDPDRYSFFNPVTGRAQVHFWRSPAGEYEFYDSEGFQPKTGDKLQPITREAIDQWKREVEELKARVRAKAEDELRQRQTLLREQQERAEEENRKRQALIQEQQRQAEFTLAQNQAEQKAGLLCDQLAANPTDRNKSTQAPGVSYDTMRVSLDEALQACSNAVRLNSSELRYKYQLARATQVNNPQEAFIMYRQLVAARYPAAYDNLGWLFIRLHKNNAEAVRLFLTGIQLGDVDSHVSLAAMVERGHHDPRSPDEAKWRLLAKAATMGHVSAQNAVAQEQARLRAEGEQQQQSQEAGRQMLRLFGNVIGNIPQR